MPDIVGEFSVVPTEWDDPRAFDLRHRMDVELVARYSGPDTPRLSETALLALAVDPADIVATVLAVDSEGTAIGHAALRILDGEWEVKRVIVGGDQRGRGVGRALMAELETIARDSGATRLILQTGNRQPEAVFLYEKIGYTPIPIYEPYSSIPFSRCYEKRLH
jgi:GNAT superfamily N-acetyltransferase